MTVLPWLVLAALVAVSSADVVTAHARVTTDVTLAQPRVTGDVTEGRVTGDVSVTSNLIATTVAREDEEPEEGICPRGCSDCMRGDIQIFYCGDQQLKYKPDDHGYVEVVCTEDKELNCSALPPLPPRRAGPLSRIEVTGCALPPHTPLLCATAGETGDALSITASRSTVTEDNLRGLDPTDVFMTFKSGVLTSLPMSALSSLSRLRSLRIMGAASPALSPHQFSSTPSLEYLELSSCGISSLPPRAFSGLSRVKILNLAWNKIQEVDEMAFEGLTSLEQLILNKNRITTLPPHALSRAPLLRTLLLDRVPLASVDNETFAGLDHLQELTLRTQSNLTLAPQALALPSLLVVRLTHSGVTSLPPALFAPRARLVNLTLSNNRLTSLEEGMFEGLSALQQLEVDHNQLRHVAGAALQPLSELRTLRLNGNLLRTLPDYLFSGLNKLHSLWLNSNQLEDISPLALSGAGSLQHVSCAFNQLAWTRSDTEASSPFTSLLQLEVLDLSHNTISAMFSDWRLVLLRLKLLDLSYNNITELTQADLQFLGSPAVVLTHNQLSSVEPRSWVQHQDLTARGAKVEVGYNPFDCDCWLYDFITEVQSSSPRYSVEGARCSAPAELRGRALAELPRERLECALPPAPGCACLLRPARQRAECSCNTTQVPDVTLYNVHSTALLLTRAAAATSLASLPATVHLLNLTALALTSLPLVPATVHTLDVTHNQVTILPDWLFSRNISIYLAGNPITCDCSTTDQVRLIQTNKHKILDYGNTVCSDGTLIQLKDVNNLCNVFKSTLAGVMFAFCVLLIAVLTALFVYHRILIQVYLYNKGWCLYLLPKEEADYSKKYDVFVSFASEDERFVHEEILPNLSGYTLHVQDRDWVVGNTIPSEIHRSVEESRRTLILFSSSFVRSKWAAEELRTVHSQATSDKRPRAVVVLLDVTKKEIEKETADLLSLCTYIRFNEVMFWEKLRYALPRRPPQQGVVAVKPPLQGLVGEKPPLSWPGGLQVVLSEEGKLINRGYVKDI